MQQRKTEKRRIALEARRLFQEGGRSKQQVFDLLHEKYGYAKDVAEAITHVPSTYALKKYGVWNTVLVILVAIAIGIKMLNGLSMYSLVFGLLAFVPAGLRRVQFYYWSAFALLLSLTHFSNDNGTATAGMAVMTVWATLLVYGPALFLFVWLKRKLAPRPKEYKETYTNSEGNQRLRIVYDFTEEFD